MFTGIITDLGRVRAVTRAGDTRVVIGTRFLVEEIAIGASIACNGACMTVIDRGRDGEGGWFAFEASAESLSRTTLGLWRAGTPVNLERSLKLGDELGGHLVSGHVDGMAEIAAITPEGDSRRFVLCAERALMRFIAPKGSVALNGVSLTVNEVEDGRFGVNIISHTQGVTTFGQARPGDPVNLEIDLLARYVARLVEKGEP